MRDANAPVVDVSVLNVAVDAEPRIVSQSMATAGCLTVVVSARNPRPRSIRVHLAGPKPFENQSFGWTLENYRSSAVSEPDSLMPFAAQETRRHVFECAYLGIVHGPNNLAPGTHYIEGRFGNQFSDSLQISIVP